MELNTIFAFQSASKLKKKLSAFFEMNLRVKITSTHYDPMVNFSYNTQFGTSVAYDGLATAPIFATYSTLVTLATLVLSS